MYFPYEKAGGGNKEECSNFIKGEEI